MRRSSATRSLGMLVGAVVAALMHSAPALGDEIDELRAQWSAGDYEGVLPRLLDYQDQPYGRNEEVFYMIATSACRVPDMHALGARCFDWILDNYRLDEASRSRVIQESENCGDSDQPLKVRLAAANRTTSGTAGVSSKMFHWIDQDNVPLADDSAKVVREIDPAVFRSRLFPLDETEQAVEKVSSLAGPDFTVAARPPFVVASRSDHTAGQVEAIGNELARAVDFYVSAYGIPEPEYLISVYLVPYVGALRDLAENLHGIEITSSSIGYSYRDDMSVLGVIPGETLGTLKHELFHLLVRNQYGDIPPWLDEGMAALYEVSTMQGDRLVGRPNWRGPVLERFWRVRPTVEVLVDADWPTLDAVALESQGTHVEQQAANHAAARYFVLYLQDTDRLVPVYEAMQSRSPTAATVPTSSQILVDVLASDIDQIDKDFVEWFNAKVAMHLDRNAVRKYQYRLESRGYDPKGTDGLMGTNTRNAIRRFQADEGLTVNGELDLYTRKALDTR